MSDLGTTNMSMPATPDETTREIVQFGSSFRKVKLSLYFHDYRIERYKEEFTQLIHGMNVEELIELLEDPDCILNYDRNADLEERKDIPLYETIEKILRCLDLLSAINSATLRKKKVLLFGRLIGSDEQATHIREIGIDEQTWKRSQNAIKYSPLEYETVLKAEREAASEHKDFLKKISKMFSIEEAEEVADVR